jgi:hypothetical protein
MTGGIAGQGSLFGGPQPAAMTPAEGAQIDRLAHGEAVPEHRSACAAPGCGHAKVWHSPTNRARPCERCNCTSYAAQS